MKRMLFIHTFQDARALFERTIHTQPAEKMESAWKLFLAYESDYGELTSAKEVQGRYLNAFPNGKSYALMNRYSYS
jgi:hypothetical protein